MNTKIFVNLPVADLPRSLAFFKALGYAHNPQFSDQSGACIVINEHIHVMLLTLPKFREFTSKDICDSAKSIEVINCLSCESRGQVEDLVRKAVAAGGSIYSRAERPGLHVSAQLCRSGWPLLGTLLYGPRCHGPGGQFHLTASPSPHPPPCSKRFSSASPWSSSASSRPPC